MTISQRMPQRRAVGQWLVLSIVAVLAFAAGSAFGIVAQDALSFSASQARLAPLAADAAGLTASSSWELYRCEGCPDVAGVVRYFTGTTPSQGPWELYHCDGCPDADGIPHYRAVN
jgi:hypothetical protein